MVNDREAWHAAVHRVAKSQTEQQSASHVRLCDPMDCSPPGSSVQKISQARMLQWIAIPFPRGSSSTRDRIRICIADLLSVPLGSPKAQRR